jgi:hypothetical protein
MVLARHSAVQSEENNKDLSDNSRKTDQEPNWKSE